MFEYFRFKSEKITKSTDTFTQAIDQRQISIPNALKGLLNSRNQGGAICQVIDMDSNNQNALSQSDVDKLLIMLLENGLLVFNLKYNYSKDPNGSAEMP